jgi:hypothetical protein
MAKSSLKKTLDNKKAAAALAAAASPSSPKVLANGQGGAKKDGRVMIGGYFHPNVQIQFKTLAVEQRKTVQTLLGEAIDLVFAQAGKSTVAKLSA